MKIAIFIDSLAIGGAQKHVRQLACGLATEGKSVTVFVLNGSVERLYLLPLLAAGVRVTIIGRLPTITGIGFIRATSKLFLEGFDCVVTVLFVSTIFGRLAAQLAGGVPVLTCLQARNVNYRLWQDWLMIATSHLTAFTVSNSRSALAWAAEYEGVNLRFSAYLPNAIDPVRDPGLPPTWAQVGLPQVENRRVIGSFGRLDRQKGYDVLLDAIASLPALVRSGLAVVVFGEGPERLNLTEHAKKLNLQDEVFFPGKRQDAVALLPRLDLYVQPSRFEGTPNALGEAMAARVPVIATSVDGNAELVHDGVRGLLVPPECPSSLRDAILRLLEDRAFSRILANCAHSFMIENYSLSRSVRGFSNLLLALSQFRS